MPRPVTRPQENLPREEKWTSPVDDVMHWTCRRNVSTLTTKDTMLHSTDSTAHVKNMARNWLAPQTPPIPTPVV